MEASMRKIAVLCVVVMLLFAIASAPALAGPVMNRILGKGELVVGITGAQPPLNATTKSGQIIGMDADLATLIAANLGVTLTLKKLPFSKLLPSLHSGKVDMVISNLTMSLERNRQVAFVGPYLASGKGILTKEANIERLQQKDGLNSPQMSVAVMRNSTSQEYVEKSSGKATLVLTDTNAAAVQMLLEDKVDAVVADYPYCSFMAFRHQEKGLQAGESTLSHEPLGIAVKEDTLLINWLENFIATIKATGTLAQIHTRWFKSGEWVKELP
jgi:polar amino acid transport system substrate-binding protein